MWRRQALCVVLVVVVLLLSVGISQVSAVPESDGFIHIVQRGDTMYSIARRYGVSVWSIANANGIVNPNYIYVGQRLCIPAGRPAAYVHVVQRGETLTRIAIRYGVSAWAIARANNLANLNYIYAGQRLVIPGAAPPVSPPKATAAPPPPSTSHPGPWSGQYFDNVTLSGTPYTTREDAGINFAWGYGPPAGGMPSNSFSVRWTGTFYLDGRYRFYAKVDDGVRVYLDDLLIIDGWRDGGLRTYSADQTVAAGDHTLKVEFYDRVQIASIYVWWAQLSGPTATPGPSPTPGASPTPTATGAPTAGWYAQFYNNMDLQDPPVLTRYDPWIGFEWGAGRPTDGINHDYFSVRWTTTAHLEAETYRFCAMADDGVRLWVGGHRVLDEWHPSNSESHCADYAVTEGDHEVKVEYYEGGGHALIYVWWEESG